MEEWTNMREQTQFVKDLDKTIDFNGNPMPIGYYNLLISIRDFKLYKSGMKPYRGWKPTAAREYFGIRKRASTETTIQMLEGWRDLMTTKQE